MKLYIAADVEQSLREAISQGSVRSFDEVASPMKWGKPSWSVSQLLLQELDDDTKRLWLWAQNLSNHRNPMTRRYATGILVKLWAEDANRTKQILLTLSDDENWVVREHAHSCWGELLKKDFQHVLPVLKELRVHSSANLRRCVAVAARSAGNTRNAEWGKPLIELLEPLLPDKTLYVRKNLGPYAIGDGLLRCYPELTLGYLRRWSHAHDEGTRWNVAMAFASHGGNRNWSEGVRILSDLATDGRRYVWRAVASALVYLARRHSDMQMTLKTWVKDPKRAGVSRTALKYIKTREFRRK